MIRNFTRILKIRTAVIISLSLLTTYLCLKFSIIFEMPTGLIGIAIVFPIVFSINSAYKRREEALVYLSSFKTAGIALFYAHRDWENRDNQEHANRIKPLIVKTFQTIHHYFGKIEEDEKDFQEIYHLFSRFSHSVEEMRKTGVSSPDISRANQCLRDMMTQFECMRNILIYRTPVSLRAYTQVFLNIFPIIFGPYFAYLSNEYFVFGGYLVAACYGLVLVSLDAIQDELENPYDGIGADDVNLNIADHYDKVMEL